PRDDTWQGSEIWKFPDFKNEFCPHFSSNFNLRLILHFESKLSDSKANFKRISRESSGDLGSEEASFEWGSIWRPFGEEKIRYRELEHA
ncbi:hypothetical protein H5410_036236, partial [Solanum commersonii]